MCENEYERHEQDSYDLQEIVTEVWHLIGVRNVFETLGDTIPAHHDGSMLDARLQELFTNLKNEPSMKLCGYIRYSSHWRKLLPTWQPLLDAAVAQARTKNKPETVEHMFVGLIPGTKMYEYNRRND